MKWQFFCSQLLNGCNKPSRITNRAFEIHTNLIYKSEFEDYRFIYNSTLLDCKFLTGFLVGVYPRRLIKPSCYHRRLKPSYNNRKVMLRQVHTSAMTVTKHVTVTKNFTYIRVLFHFPHIRLSIFFQSTIFLSKKLSFVR